MVPITEKRIGPRTKADFRNKIRICEGEANETQFWIEVIAEVGWLSSKEVKSVNMKKSGELLALFTSIGKSTS